MIQNGTLLQDRYLIEREIGAGGMGAVYLAVDQRFESYVAIKQTFYSNDELGEAFEREARLLNSLLHPALPHVSDYFTEAGGHFLVMQYIEGEDLFAVLKREGAFPVRDVLRWTDNLLDALDYLHSQDEPIIHRDIKPHNLKITPRGEVILLDFGLAKLKSDNTTGVKSVFGYSRKYSPLEQIQGTGTDARSDLFALAATAYHLLTGKPPIDVLARASEIIIGNPDPLQLVSEINQEVPVSVANVLHTAMALNSAGRFVSAKAMRHALENAAVGAFSVAEETTVLADEQIIAPVIAAENAVVISPENEDFPALEAFAASAAADVSQPAAENVELAKNIESVENIEPVKNVEVVESVENNQFAADKVSFTPEAEETALPTVAQPNLPPLPESTALGDVATKVSPRHRRNINVGRQSRVPLAVLAALIICACLAAAGYFINRVNSSNQSPTVETVQESNPETNQTAVVPDSPIPEEEEETADAPLPENVEQAKTKPLPIEKKVEKKEIVDPTETAVAEKPKPVEVEEAPRPAQAQNQRRTTEPPRRNQTSTRRVESEPVPDIESVFTGRSSEARQRRSQSRREPPEDMSEEEWREWRRQRRQERRQRQEQNRRYFPF
ncbi:MAG TPA: protein kinase [Pyrinomonadaceae bacterium]|nr:protein kinase [Pyrinomonadaceae bacterium]